MADSLAEYRTKTDLVYAALRERILLGRYPPGARIVVDQLAQELGTSKVPVREAVVRLAGEGWLQMQPHVGATVPELHPQEILETAIIRGALESVAVRLSIEHLTTAIVDKLRSLTSRMEAAIESGSADYPDLNVDFHSTTFAACPYPNLRTMAASVLEKSRRLRTVRFLPEYLPESQREHRRLLEAIERRDASAAEKLTRQHIERAGQLLWTFAVEHGAADQDDIEAHERGAKGRRRSAILPARLV